MIVKTNLVNKKNYSIIIPPLHHKNKIECYISFYLDKNLFQPKKVNLCVKDLKNKSGIQEILADNLSLARGKVLLSELAKVYSLSYGVEMIVLGQIQEQNPILSTFLIPTPYDMDGNDNEIHFSISSNSEGSHVYISSNSLSKIFSDNTLNERIGFPRETLIDKIEKGYLIKSFSAKSETDNLHEAEKFLAERIKSYAKTYGLLNVDC